MQISKLSASTELSITIFRLPSQHFPPVAVQGRTAPGPDRKILTMLPPLLSGQSASLAPVPLAVEGQVHALLRVRLAHAGGCSAAVAASDARLLHVTPPRS